MTFKQACDIYVNALNSPANGWGQHLIDGVQSHHYLNALNKTYGVERVMEYLDNEFDKETLTCLNKSQ
tara:strand:+ start:250 stop:453 length:204 start_codon:yes stop_codon:yes gene_type:complete